MGIKVVHKASIRPDEVVPGVVMGVTLTAKCFFKDRDGRMVWGAFYYPVSPTDDGSTVDAVVEGAACGELIEQSVALKIFTVFNYKELFRYIRQGEL